MEKAKIRRMRTTVGALIVAISIVCCQGAGAVPVAGTAAKQAATAVSVVQQVQYAYRRTKHGVERCYHRNRFGSRRSRWERWWSSVPDC
jgi:hypothetical protein